MRIKESKKKERNDGNTEGVPSLFLPSLSVRIANKAGRQAGGQAYQKGRDRTGQDRIEMPPFAAPSTSPSKQASRKQGRRRMPHTQRERESLTYV